VGVTEEVEVAAGYEGWVEFPFPAESRPPIADATHYVIAVWSSSDDLDLAYDTESGQGWIDGDGTSYDGWPDPAEVEPIAEEVGFSIFCTVLTGYAPPTKSGELEFSYATGEFGKGGLLPFSYGVGREGALVFSYGVGRGGELPFSYGVGAQGELPFSYGADGREGRLAFGYGVDAGRQGALKFSYGADAVREGELAFSYTADAVQEGELRFSYGAGLMTGGDLPFSYGAETLGAWSIIVILLEEDTMVR